MQMISRVITISGLTEVARMLEDPEANHTLSPNDWHNIATACLDELDNAERRPLLVPHYRRIYQIAVKHMAAA